MNIVTTTCVFPPEHSVEGALLRLRALGFRHLDLAMDYCVKNAECGFATDAWEPWARALRELADKNGVSSFQALMVSTASRVGPGNIIGVSTALCLGGFGSVFWMWLIALIGSASALVESTLAQIYKKKGADECYGGPAYYIEAALHSRPLAIVFSIFLILTYGFGFNMLPEAFRSFSSFA